MNDNFVQATRLMLEGTVFSDNVVEFKTPGFADVFFVEGVQVVYGSVYDEKGNCISNYKGKASLFINNEPVSTVEVDSTPVPVPGTDRSRSAPPVLFPNAKLLKMPGPGSALVVQGYRVSARMQFSVKMDGEWVNGMHVQLQGVLLHEVPDTPAGSTVLE